MFSGIVEEIGIVTLIDQSEPARLSVKSKLDQRETKIGDSIAVNGVCLTVVKNSDRIIEFELSQETIRRTNLLQLKAGSHVNLERSLKVGERIHGHFVFGHVDGQSELIERKSEGASDKLIFRKPADLSKFIVEKGSITLNGVSLTIGTVEQESFAVYVIPHTLQATNLGALKLAESVNLEIDMLARYVLNKENGK